MAASAGEGKAPGGGKGPAGIHFQRAALVCKQRPNASLCGGTPTTHLASLANHDDVARPSHLQATF